ncbi:hypothetical protein NDU88_009606 [Pleurodeles waltl]|uniref:Uncharacterized protein n=1 Tax=Pleurodeles waltl TaxID=8319 RepID=A0AAV7PVP5_PLEWA|nr:hypothetical protein NDU88_009606 [Pleurodeles waltl]
MRGAACAPGGLPSCPCLLGWLECFPWHMASAVRGTEQGWGPWRSADFDRRAGGGSGLIEVIPSAHD